MMASSSANPPGTNTPSGPRSHQEAHPVRGAFSFAHKAGADVLQYSKEFVPESDFTKFGFVSGAAFHIHKMPTPKRTVLMK